MLSSGMLASNILKEKNKKQKKIDLFEKMFFVPPINSNIYLN